MTTFWVRTALLGASAMALQACDLPHSQYAPYEGYQAPTSRPLAKPEYPVTADQPAPPMRSADPHDPVAKPSGDVTAQPLPPPGPSSANRSMFINASYEAAEPAFLTEVAYRHRRGRPVHVSSGGRPERSAEAHSVKIRKGDTIDALADRYGTTKQAILKANGIRHPHELKVGSTLKIPSAAADVSASDVGSASDSSSEPRSSSRSRAAARAASKPYEAQHGDTLYSLGRRFHVSPKTLAELNGLPGNAHLHVGQTVKLPGQEEEAQAPAPPSRRVAEAHSRGRAHGAFETPQASNDAAVAGGQSSMAAGDTSPPRRSSRMERNDRPRRFPTTHCPAT